MTRQRSTFLKTTFCLVLLVATSAFPAITVSQDGAGEKNPTDSEKANEETTSLEAPDKIDVNPVARDDEIATRLVEILESTQWYQSPNVTVDNGVVFLTGKTNTDEHKKWATELAGNTQDVAAVVNRMTVIEKSIWDFSGAFGELREFQAGAIQAIPLIIFGVIVIFVTWLLARLTGAIANRLLSKRVPNSLLRWVATRAIMLPVLIFGVYLVLRVAGLTQLALTVLGGTGLIGLIIGIAFQDIAENFLASILISVQQPFRIGDLVSVAGHEGIVQRVTTRGTSLLTADGNHVQVPNAQIYKQTIVNFTANPLRRVSFDIGIGYDDSTTDAQRIILEKVKEHSAALNEPAPKVLIENLGAATVVLRVFFWIDGTKNDWRSVRSSVMRISKQALQQKGISLPDESREVIFPQGVPVTMLDPSVEREKADSALISAGGGHDVRHDPEQSNSRTNVSAQPKEEDIVEAEGSMASDTDHLRKQARQSWLPGEGDDILVGDSND